MTLGDKIKQARELRELSQEGLAKRIGRHQSRLSQWEHDEGEPKPRDLLRLSLELQVPLVYLCDDAIKSVEEAREPIPPVAGARKLWGIVLAMGIERALARLLGLPDPASGHQSIPLATRDDVGHEAPPPAPDRPRPRSGGRKPGAAEGPIPDAPEAPGVAKTLKTVKMPRRKPEASNNSAGEPPPADPKPAPPPKASRPGPKKRPGAR